MRPAEDAVVDALLELRADLGGENVLEESRGSWALARRPREVLVERGSRVRQSEELEMAPESFEDEVVARRKRRFRWGCAWT